MVHRSIFCGIANLGNHPRMEPLRQASHIIKYLKFTSQIHKNGHYLKLLQGPYIPESHTSYMSFHLPLISLWTQNPLIWCDRLRLLGYFLVSNLDKLFLSYANTTKHVKFQQNKIWLRTSLTFLFISYICKAHPLE